MSTTKPFVFTIEGEFRQLRLHVINGACPVHARIHQTKIPQGKQPYEREFTRLRGRLVGIYADNAVGELTHPAMKTHLHVVFVDETTGKQLTGHIESTGVFSGATLKLPRLAAQRD